MKTLLFALILFFPFIVKSQTDILKTKQDSISEKSEMRSQHENKSTDNRPLKERIAFGFSSSFWFNANMTYIELGPVLAYRFPKALIAGIGYRYIYRHDRFYGVDL